MFGNYITLESLKSNRAHHTDIAGSQSCGLDDPVQHRVGLCLHAGLAVRYHKGLDNLLGGISHPVVLGAVIVIVLSNDSITQKV